MKTGDEILELLAQAMPELRRKFKVSRLALFGSYARGEQRSDSDVDILVDVDPSIGLEFVSMADKIEGLIGVPVQVVSRRAVKPRMLKHIEKDLIYV